MECLKRVNWSMKTQIILCCRESMIICSIVVSVLIVVGRATNTPFIPFSTTSYLQLSIYNFGNADSTQNADSTLEKRKTSKS